MLKKPLILSVAKGYNRSQLEPFLESLQATSYEGDICFFVADMNEETRRYLDEKKVILLPFHSRLFTGWRRHLLRQLLSWSQLKKSTKAAIQLSQIYLHPIDARWSHYYLYLQEVIHRYTHFLLVDSRDVIFQANPFDFEWKGELCVFDEGGRPIKSSPYNMGWLETAYGVMAARALQDKLIYCAGVVFATRAIVMDYLRLMNEQLIRVNARWNLDQGIHNYMIHHQLLHGIACYDGSESPVFNNGQVAAALADKGGSGEFVNSLNKRVNVIHQYDRFPSALQWIQERYRSKS